VARVPFSTFDKIVSHIEAKDFGMASRPEKMCPDCDIRPYCDNKIWKFKENE
jgi:DNA helicase-2/ATP-dependent DNA helicase PcrA